MVVVVMVVHGGGGWKCKVVVNNCAVEKSRK